MVDTNTANIVNAAIAALPSILGAIKSEHAAANPGAPELTEAQALKALQDAVAASLAEDAKDRQAFASPADLGFHANTTGD